MLRTAVRCAPDGRSAAGGVSNTYVQKLAGIGVAIRAQLLRIRTRIVCVFRSVRIASEEPGEGWPKQRYARLFLIGEQVAHLFFFGLEVARTGLVGGSFDRNPFLDGDAV